MINKIELIFNKKIEEEIALYLENVTITGSAGGDSSRQFGYHNKNVIYDPVATDMALKVFKDIHKKNIEDEINKKIKRNKIYAEIESKIEKIVESLNVPYLFKFDNELSLNIKTPDFKYYFQKYGGDYGNFLISHKGDLSIGLSMKRAEINFGYKKSDKITDIFNSARNETIKEIFASLKKPDFLKDSQNLLPTARKINAEIESFTKENMKKDRLFIYNLTKDFSINLRADDPFADFEIIKIMSDAPIIYVFLKHLEKIKENIKLDNGLKKTNLEN